MNSIFEEYITCLVHDILNEKLKKDGKKDITSSGDTDDSDANSANRDNDLGPKYFKDNHSKYDVRYSKFK